MTQQIKDNIDKGNLAVGVFVDFKKIFGTMNHKIFLRKLEHYGIRGVLNDCFFTSLTECNMYQSMELIQQLNQYYTVYLKGLFLIHYFSLYASMILIDT